MFSFTPIYYASVCSNMTNYRRIFAIKFIVSANYTITTIHWIFATEGWNCVACAVLKLINLPQRLPFHLTFLKAQQLVAVVCVLLFAGGQLCGQLCGQLGKSIQNADNFRLDFERFLGVVGAGDGN